MIRFQISLFFCFLLLSCKQEKGVAIEIDAIYKEDSLLSESVPKLITSPVTEQSDTIAWFSSYISVYLMDEDSKGTNVRAKPNGEIITILKNDTISEDYPILRVLEMEDDWIKVKLESDSVNIGYVHNSVVGLHLQNYEGFLTLKNYPSFQAKNVFVFSVEDMYHTNTSVRLLNIKDGWCQIFYQGQKLWVVSGALCGDPYTTCT